jgi:hypothetical protein
LPGRGEVGKSEADDRVERSLYQSAVGYSYDSVKILQACWCERADLRAVRRVRAARCDRRHLLVEEQASRQVARRLARSALLIDAEPIPQEQLPGLKHSSGEEQSLGAAQQICS